MNFKEWSSAFLRQTVLAAGVFLIVAGIAEFLWPGSVLSELGSGYYLAFLGLSFLIVITVSSKSKDGE